MSSRGMVVGYLLLGLGVILSFLGFLKNRSSKKKRSEKEIRFGRIPIATWKKVAQEIAGQTLGWYDYDGWVVKSIDHISYKGSRVFIVPVYRAIRPVDASAVVVIFEDASFACQASIMGKPKYAFSFSLDPIEVKRDS